MRITDHRYNGERARFDLAVRMIGHEARTGTIRACTGFSEDRIRKIYTSYFKDCDNNAVKRRRGKSPSQIANFISTSNIQFESTILACLFVLSRAVEMNQHGDALPPKNIDKVLLGQRICDSFESYKSLLPTPKFSFERAWGLFNALTHANELSLSNCESCNGTYIHDRYALNYHFCPACELLDQSVAITVGTT